MERIFFDKTKVTDVSPLLDCPNLAEVILSKTVTNREVLRKHSGLKYIGYSFGEGHPPQTAEQFWQMLDRGKTPK